METSCCQGIRVSVIYPHGMSLCFMNKMHSKCCVTAGDFGTSCIQYMLLILTMHMKAFWWNNQWFLYTIIFSFSLLYPTMQLKRPTLPSGTTKLHLIFLRTQLSNLSRLVVDHRGQSPGLSGSRCWRVSVGFCSPCLCTCVLHDMDHHNPKA